MKRPTIPPLCPDHATPMVRRPDADLTPEQEFAGVWWDCHTTDTCERVELTPTDDLMAAFDEADEDQEDAEPVLEHRIVFVPCDKYKHLQQPTCTCGWDTPGTTTVAISEIWAKRHLAEVGAPAA